MGKKLSSQGREVDGAANEDEKGQKKPMTDEEAKEFLGL
jgi:hypothetical protein